MFYIAEMKMTVKIEPRYIDTPIRDPIMNEINSKLAGKVIVDVGLCISLYEITDCPEGHILPGEGYVYYPTTFKYIVFRPNMSEVIVGKVKSSNYDGIKVSLGFFDDIFIPKHAMQNPSRFDENEQHWVWEYGVGEEKHCLPLEVNESIRFRVIGETFTESVKQSPTDSNPKNETPYLITAGINESGLGMLHWWNNN